MVVEYSNGTANIDDIDSMELIQEIMESQDFHHTGDFDDVKSAAKEIESDDDAGVHNRYIGPNPFDDYSEDEDDCDFV